MVSLQLIKRGWRTFKMEMFFRFVFLAVSGFLFFMAWDLVMTWRQLGKPDKLDYTFVSVLVLGGVLIGLMSFGV